MSEAAETGQAPAYSRAYVLYAIGIVFLVSVFNIVDRTIVALLVPGIKADLGLSDAQLGLLLGPSFSVVHFLAVLPCAWLADRTSRRRVIAWGLFIWSGMTALGGAAQSFTQLFVTRMGVGLGEAAGSPPAVSLITDTAPVEWRTRALASITLGALVGIGIGTMFGGWVSQYYGWRWALASVGLPGLGVALLARYTLREPPRNSTEVAPDPLRVARYLCSFPAFNWTVVAACIAGVGSFGRSMWEPTFLSRTYGLTPFEIGTTYLLISALPAAAGAIVASVQADRLGRRDARWPLWICALGNGLGFPCLIAFFLWPTDDTLMLGSLEVPVSYGFSFVGSAFLGFYSAPTGAVAQRFASSNMRAVTHALWTMVFNLIGMGLGPLIVGGLTQTWSDTYGPDALRYALVLITLVLPVSALAYVVAAARLPKDLVRLEAMEAAEGDGQA